MTKWFAQFRISTALDSGASSRQTTVCTEAERRRCEESMKSLDRQLKAAQPTKEVPTVLHESILRAVYAADRAQQRQAAPAVWRWLPAPALALLAVIGLWSSLNRAPHESQSLAVTTAALEQSHAITQTVPAAVLAPLSEEMEYLNRDFHSAVDFLLATVP